MGILLLRSVGSHCTCMNKNLIHFGTQKTYSILIQQGG